MEKKALTYTLEIERQDDGYLAYFPALPGCHTSGRTYEAAVKHAEEALIGFLEALQMNGEDIPAHLAASSNLSISASFRKFLPHSCASVVSPTPRFGPLSTLRRL